MEMYRRNSEAYARCSRRRRSFGNESIANYPFHPTLVDFLNHKLAVAENFQGTRRRVPRASPWRCEACGRKGSAVPYDSCVSLRLAVGSGGQRDLGRTGSSDLIFVLTQMSAVWTLADLEGGQSNPEVADERNPHPEGYPIHEYAWKTVFLHSLVGRSEGSESNIFGLTE